MESVEEQLIIESGIEVSHDDLKDKYDISCDRLYHHCTGAVTDQELMQDNFPIHLVQFRGKFYRYDSWVWFLANGSWINEFINIDGDKTNGVYRNLLPLNFTVEEPVFSQEELEQLLEYDEADGSLYWYHNSSKHGFWNCLLPFTKANKVYRGMNYVDIFGHIYFAKDIVNILLQLGLDRPISPIDGDEKNVRIENLTSSFESTSDTSDLLDSANDYITKTIIDSGAIVLGEKVGRERILSCFYCGDNTAITRDHVIPVSLRGTKRNFDRRDTVQCCSECNSLLGNKLLFTVERRAAYLADKLATRHKKKLSVYPFKEEELAEFGTNLKSMVAANLNLKGYIAARISHCHEVAGSIYNEQDVAHLRGITTEAKRTAYGIIEDFLHEKQMSNTEFYEEKAKQLKTDEKIISQIVSGTLHYDVSVQYKYDHHFSLDVSIRKIRSMLFRS